MGQALEGFRVIEVATGIAGPFAGKLFADFGAEVIKVELPEGDPARLARLYPEDDLAAPDALETGPLFLHLNTNKRGIVLDLLGSAADRATLAALCADADLLIESFPPGTMAAWGLGPEVLRAANPRLVVCQVTPFGQDGPYAQLESSEIALYAIAGPMSSTGVIEREPAKHAGEVVQYQCGNVAAMACLAALRRAEGSGVGATIDVANLETQLGSIDRRVTYLLWQQWSGLEAPRTPSYVQYPVPIGVYPTGDGHAMVYTLANWIPGMLATFGDASLAARYADPTWPTDDVDLPGDTEAVLYPWLLERTRREAMIDAQANRWPITAVNAPVDLLDDPHFAEREFFVDVDHPVAGRYRTPGAPWRMPGGWALRRPAPLLGEHTAEVLAELTSRPVAATPSGFSTSVDSSNSPPLGESTSNRRNVAARRMPQQEGEIARSVADRLPLAGVKVLDLTVVWSGPYCTMLLGDLGADVYRLDNPWVFPTATRGTVARPVGDRDAIAAAGPLAGYVNCEPGERPWNRHSMYSAQARNKWGVTLDIRKPLGRETFLRLAAQADVFVENNSASVLDKLGIGWDTLHAAAPQLIVVRMAPLGLTGPYRDFIGFGVHFEGLCGFNSIRGYRDTDPSINWTTFHMDPATGPAGAFAIMAALRRREETGIGELIEFAQAENMMQHLGEHYVDATRTGRRFETIGNRHPTWAPQGCYPCTGGTDQWAVLSVRTDVEWDALCEVMDRPELSGLSTAERRARHDELDEVITAWTATRTPTEVFERLQAVGIPAGAVNHESEVLRDPHLLARDAFRPNGSVDTDGDWLFPRHVFRWDGPPLRWDPLCRLGADNDWVYRDAFGFSEAQVEALRADGHFSLDYLKPDGTPW